jgi:hypothetical protein
MCLLALIFIFVVAGELEPPELIDYVDWAFTFLVMSGVFAFCYSKRFFGANFWKCLIPVVILWDFYFLSDIFMSDAEIQYEQPSFEIIVLLALISLVVLVPGYVALYLLSNEYEKIT